MTLYSRSSSAWESPSSGLKSTTRSSLTAKTVSVASHGSSLGYSCVVQPLKSGCVTYTMASVSLTSLLLSGFQVRHSRPTYHDVNVRRAHRVPVHERQQVVARPVSRQRVGRRVVAVEPVLAVLVGAELATQVVGCLCLRVLEVVLAVGAGLPDVEDGPGDGLARQQVRDGAVHLADAAARRRVLDDGGAVFPEGSIGRPEGAEDGRRGWVDVSLGDDFVGDFVDEPLEQSVSKPVGERDSGGVKERGVRTTRGRECRRRGAPRCASWSTSGPRR